ncbi:hypothetical protein SBA3_2260016 [Candidatus Sulfopaludibacter sp. SbA3]|nr:hypothetical protein SBA3_2260016 [Candidatus Sulfopaludibacter sp. SbA3]
MPPYFPPNLFTWGAIVGNGILYANGNGRCPRIVPCRRRRWRERHDSQHIRPVVSGIPALGIRVA